MFIYLAISESASTPIGYQTDLQQLYIAKRKVKIMSEYPIGNKITTKIRTTHS